MDEPVGPGRMRFKLYGQRMPGQKEAVLSASVFAKKVLSLLHAASAADRAANRKRKFDYVIVSLKDGSGIIEVEERPVRHTSAVSPIDALSHCLSSIREPLI